MFPNATLNTASQGESPRPTKDEAIVKDGMQTDIPTHSMLMWYVVHVR